MEFSDDVEVAVFDLCTFYGRFLCGCGAAGARLCDIFVLEMILGERCRAEQFVDGQKFF